MILTKFILKNTSPLYRMLNPDEDVFRFKNSRGFIRVRKYSARFKKCINLINQRESLTNDQFKDSVKLILSVDLLIIKELLKFESDFYKKAIDAELLRRQNVYRDNS
jgi:hypothetical protein